MRIIWSSAGWADVERLYSFMADKDLKAADALVDRLADAPLSLVDFPRLGPRLSQFDPREVRELRVGRYLMRYELAEDRIYILRLFHSRENRY